MIPFKHKVLGRVVEFEGESAVILDENADTLWIGYAMVELGTDALLFPEVVVDDWGTEITKSKMFRWIREFGMQFPRSEVFGFTPEGKQSQWFVRELEHAVRFPCFVYPEKESAVSEGIQLRSVIVLDESVEGIEKSKRPKELKRPIPNAGVRWWRANPSYL